MKFSDLSLFPSIQKSLEKQGFENATPIQEQAIPVILQGSDLVARAQTGSGKTGAYLIPLMSQLAENRERRIIILVPVRELAEQVKQEVEKLGSAARLKTAVITGGKSYRWQIQDTQEAQVVVATPGRLLDLMDSGSLPEFVPSTLIIDEADRMLDMGFIDDVKKILQFFKNEKQTLLFSATYPKEIMHLVKTFMKSPVNVEVAQESKTNLDVTQTYAVVPYNEKEAALIRLLEARSTDKIIVFTNTKKGADELGHQLQGIGISNLILHGDTEQKNREKVIRAFKSGHARVLVATDIAARGLDIKDIGLVVNYDIPKDFDTYVHRIGRTGRAGAKGEAISLVEPGEIRNFFSLQRVVKSKVEFVTIPGHADLMEAWESDLFARVEAQHPDNLARKIAAVLAQSESVEQDLARLVQLVLGTKVLRGNDSIGFKTPPKEESKDFSGRSTGGRNEGRFGGSRGGSSRGGRYERRGPSEGASAPRRAPSSEGASAPRRERTTERSFDRSEAREGASAPRRERSFEAGSESAPRRSYTSRDGASAAPRRDRFSDKKSEGASSAPRRERFTESSESAPRRERSERPATGGFSSRGPKRASSGDFRPQRSEDPGTARRRNYEF